LSVKAFAKMVKELRGVPSYPITVDITAS